VNAPVYFLIVLALGGIAFFIGLWINARDRRKREGKQR
jgi:hypothetical protein